MPHEGKGAVLGFFSILVALLCCYLPVMTYARTYVRLGGFEDP
jgi:hypothetical protein